MAEGTLFDVANGIIGKLGNRALQEILLIWGVKDEIRKFTETVSTIRAVLLDAEAKQHNNEVKVWLERLKDAMFDADDLLDDISTEALRREVMTRNNKTKEVRIFFSTSNQLAYGLKMGHKVKAMRERLDEIAVDKNKFHLEQRSEERQVRFKAREQTYSVVRVDDVIGREDDKKAIIGSLLNPNVKEDVSVLPIVGIGGLGKTTLAQLVFNDEEIKKHFEQKLWVCVSEDFDIKIIVEKILECVKNKKPKNLEMNTLVNDLQKEVNGKRYLLVLDDVWNEDLEEWRKLKDLLMGGARGSRILVTTRSIKVAEITQTVQPHLLNSLDEQQSWSLFKKMAFVEGEEPKNARLVEIGKEILKKCVGVPLAIRTIGSLMYFKKSEIEWLSFKNNELSKIPQKENDILPTLKLSYDLLPSHLKQCFAYCSLFPKDYEIDKLSLIQMWMAQGFITLCDQNPEDVGHEYFMDLFWRSFFQEVEEDGFGSISQLKIHDLMHDIAILASRSESTTFSSKDKNIDEKTRHVSFGDTFDSSLQIPNSLYKARKIRTFLLPSQPKYDSVRLDKSPYNPIVASFNFIRLLDLHNMGIKTIPSSIKKLKHLRYLDLSYNGDIEMLPNSIVKLHNLQTLKLFWCSKLKELPRDINKLVKLRHLEIDECSGLTHMPLGLGQLTDLHTLSRFVMSKDTVGSVTRINGGLKELQELNKLSGNLSIENLRHGKDAALESQVANLKAKQRLDGLELKWIEEDIDETGVGYDEMSLEALQPQPNLKALKLSHYGGVRFPSWVLSLTSLVKFELYSCKKCQHLPPLDQFSSLKSLYLDRLDSVEYISERDKSEEGLSDSSFLPSLEKLSIRYCRNLKGWWRGRRDSVEEIGITTPITSNPLNYSFPRLSQLYISNCPQLTYMPLFPYLEELNLENCCWIEEDIDEAGVGYDEMSLEALQTQPNLKALNLENYGGVSFLSRVLSLTSLVEFHLSSCECQHLPPLDQFSSLKSLALYWLDSLEYIDKSEERLSDSSFLPSLETLYIEKCPNLKGWWRGRRDSVEEIGITTPITSNPLNYSFPRLSKLEITHCPQLTYMPLFPYLEHLSLCECSLKPLEQTMRMGMINMTASPSISSSSSILSFAPLSKLNYMWIDDMDEALSEELLRNLISLRTLYLCNCPLPPQGMRYLTALQSLNVGWSEVVDPFNDWDEMEWQGLRSLLSLWFGQLPELVSLPVGLQQLTSLQTLEIWGCPKLTSLPEWIGGLTSLQTLDISECPILSTRCKREIGEDWPKIAKIPNLRGDLSPPEEDSDKKKAALKNRNLIKSFGCCNCSTADGTS